MDSPWLDSLTSTRRYEHQRHRLPLKQERDGVQRSLAIDNLGWSTPGLDHADSKQMDRLGAGHCRVAEVDRGGLIRGVDL